jgi:hypothetical protein
METFQATWNQNYAIDRFDLEDNCYRLIGWITRNRIDNNPEPSQVYIMRNEFGYVTHYRNDGHPEAKYIWRVWWAERDEKGYYKGESSSDEIQYLTMEEAKQALEKRFLPPEAKVKTVSDPRNFTNYS